MRLKSFGVKLWIYFAAFTAIMFCVLWLVQIVFLQSFYNSMKIKNVEKAAAQIAGNLNSNNIYAFIDELAYNNSLLIFLTDENGSVIYNTDEHADLYQEHKPYYNESNSGNPHDNSGELKNWQIGAARNLPHDYTTFLQKLAESTNGTVGYKSENSDSYIFGRLLDETWAHSNHIDSGKIALYLSSPLEAVGGTVDILRVQLIWTTVISLIIGMIIALFASRRFSKPVASISAQAKKMADGDFKCEFQKGFCSELDALADTLKHTAQELEKTDESRRDFLANISHDLRTPLTMIKGYAETIKDFSWEDDKERNADLDVIIKEADRLTALVNDILEYSAFSSSNATEYEKINISILIQSVIAQFSLLCKNKNCVVSPNIAPQQMIFGSAKQLERVLYNLIDNALTHSKKNGRIDVILTRINDNVRIEVRDYGKGIPQDELAYIWDRYFTMKQQKRNAAGSGLGLAISKEILLAHKADFGVESEVGQGSVFWFELKGL